MDFARPHIEEESVTTKSQIRPIPESIIDSEQDELHKMVLQSANHAITNLFQHPLSSKHAQCDSYPDRMCPLTSTISEGSLVVISESFDKLTFCYVKKGETFHNRNGIFHHDDFINQPFGCKIRSRDNEGAGFVHVLRPTVELWSRSLNHRTQIIYDLDASLIVFHLNLSPGCVVAESGTGSGAMSHAILRCIAPSGHLHTFEFNKMRVQTAREEFRNNNLHRLVTVHFRDVCGKKVKSPPPTTSSKSQNDKDDDPENIQEEPSGGFGLGKHAADAVFLDLPEPWLAVPHAAYTLKQNARIASYSPCMEQTQRTVEALTRYRFHSIKTVEVRLRQYYVDDLELEPPPAHILSVTDTKDKRKVSQKQVEQEEKKQQMDNPMATSDSSADDDAPLTFKKRKITCARPFATMRGHTAFLTFATAGLVDVSDITNVNGGDREEEDKEASN